MITFSNDNILSDLMSAGSILLGAIALAWLVKFISSLVKRRITQKRPESTLSVTIDSSITPVILLILVEGVILALLSTETFQPWHPAITKASAGVIIAVATYALARVFGGLLSWQLTRLKQHSKKPLDLGVALFFKGVAQIVIYVVGALVLLQYLGFGSYISPLIASLGIGGLAVALALQPLLSNFFGGIQVLSDRAARVGDFIEVDDKTRGYVTAVGWRSTKIRTPFNNILTIPNSILANSQVTNYNIPNSALGMSIECGVSYDSDLAKVKRIALEVANDVIQSMDEANKSFEPWVAFDNFGDSNINFWVWVQAKDRLSSFNLKSELIMRLHARFKEENITINYPVRMTYLKWMQEYEQDSAEPNTGNRN